MKRRDIVVLLLCVLLISNVATYFLTRFLFSPQPAADVSSKDDMHAVFWEVWDILEENYYQPLDEEEMMIGAVEGMLRSLEDPHTSYLSPDSLEEMLIQTRGSFSGIGVEITEDEGEILVLRVIEDSPAHEAGLHTGDRIVEVDGESLEEVALEEAAQLLRGPEGTSVDITVRRPEEGSFVEVALTRSEIDVVTVSHRMMEDDIGYIEIRNFDGNTTDEFSKALSSMEDDQLKGLVIDLRNNPGGLLEEAVELGKLIVPSGEITRMVDRDGEVIERHFSHAEEKEYPIAVLVNEYTASAAEIIAGALQESEQGVLVGEPTFGKASVQHLKYLSDGGGLRYTIANYLTPEGKDLDRYGLSPDVEVKLPEEYFLKYSSIPKDLEPDDTGQEVVLLQEMLKFLGNPLQVTGVFDQQTSEALEEFQQSYNLPLTGKLNSATREKIRQLLSDEVEKVDIQLKEAVKLLKDNDL